MNKGLEEEPHNYRHYRKPLNEGLREKLQQSDFFDLMNLLPPFLNNEEIPEPFHHRNYYEYIVESFDLDKVLKRADRANFISKVWLMMLFFCKNGRLTSQPELEYLQEKFPDERSRRNRIVYDVLLGSTSSYSRVPTIFYFLLRDSRIAKVNIDTKSLEGVINFTSDTNNEPICIKSNPYIKDQFALITENEVTLLELSLEKPEPLSERLILKKGIHNVTEIKFSPNGRIAVLLGIGEQSLKVWELYSNKVHSMRYPGYMIETLEFSSSGHYVCGYSNTINQLVFWESTFWDSQLIVTTGQIQKVGWELFDNFLVALDMNLNLSIIKNILVTSINSKPRIDFRLNQYIKLKTEGKRDLIASAFYTDKDEDLGLFILSKNKIAGEDFKCLYLDFYSLKNISDGTRELYPINLDSIDLMDSETARDMFVKNKKEAEEVHVIINACRLIPITSFSISEFNFASNDFESPAEDYNHGFLNLLERISSIDYLDSVRIDSGACKNIILEENFQNTEDNLLASADDQSNLVDLNEEEKIRFGLVNTANKQGGDLVTENLAINISNVGTGTGPSSETNKKPKRKIKTLAHRNMKLNMATGLLQFIEFNRRMAARRNNKSYFLMLDEVFDLFRDKQVSLRNFDGWRNLYHNEIYGKQIRKLAINFFKGQYVKNYICHSKIKKEYKAFYEKKIPFFLEGARCPNKFEPFYFD